MNRISGNVSPMIQITSYRWCNIPSPSVFIFISTYCGWHPSDLQTTKGIWWRNKRTKKGKVGMMVMMTKKMRLKWEEVEQQVDEEQWRWKNKCRTVTSKSRRGSRRRRKMMRTTKSNLQPSNTILDLTYEDWYFLRGWSICNFLLGY